jgi:hypothetical protein
MWLSATYRQCDYAECMMKYCGHTVDAQFQNVVGRVLLYFWPIQAANTSIMCNHNQNNFILPDLDDLKSVLLH